MKSNSKKRLASLALFRKLYDDHKDIYSILNVFIKDIVQQKGLVSFTATEIKNYINEDYGFNAIPESVITTTLRQAKYIKAEGKFHVDSNNKSIGDEENLIPNANEISEMNDLIINALIIYVESKAKITLSSTEKEELTQSFCEFIIGGTVSNYEEYISAFIVSHQTDIEFAKGLNTIKEGVVLYSGIQYNEKVNEKGSWKSPLILYLEQDIIFHIAGYNGELYQCLFEDFYSLVKEINSTAKKTLVKLKYFSEVRDNIDHFFDIAERIVEGKEKLDYSNNAMYQIVSGCRYRSDVVAKKAELIALLKAKEIYEDDQTGYFEDKLSHQYNIETEELFAYCRGKLPDVKENKLHQSLNFLTYINIKREGRNNVGFHSIRHILLSGNSTTITLAFDEHIKCNGNVPYATYLDYITNKFWFMLNKGFGDSSYPKTFDIITRAQIAMSSQLNDSIAKDYEQLERKRENGELSDEQAKEALAMIRQQSKYPEEIDAENVDIALDAIKIGDIEQLIRESEIKKVKNQEQNLENERLRQSLDKERKEKEKHQTIIKEKENNNQRLVSQMQASIRSEIAQIDAHIADIKKRKEIADLRIDKKVKSYKLIPLGTVFVYFILTAVAIYIFSWDKIEPIAHMVGLFVVVAQYLFYTICGKSFNPCKYFDVTIKKKITEKVYEDRSISLVELEKLRLDKENKKEQLIITDSSFEFNMTNM